MSYWVYKGDFGRYLHSFGREYKDQFQDCRWSKHQHDAYRFADRNFGAYVAMRSGEAGTLKRLKPKKPAPESVNGALVRALMPFTEIDPADAMSLGIEDECREAREVIEWVASQRQGTPHEKGNGE